MTRIAIILLWLASIGDARAEPAGLVEVIAAARGADIVLVGEIHDNPAHHLAQAEIVAALQPGGLVFEMIPQAREDEVNRLRAAGATREELAAALDWDESGWPDFEHYARILEAAPEARIFGGGQPAEEVRRAAAVGAAEAFGPDAVTFGLDLPLPEDEQARREAEMLAVHCDAIPAAILPGLVEAQRFRDAALADAARWARTISGSSGPVVVIAGSGHVNRLHGAPAMLAVADPSLLVLAVGQFEAARDGDGDGAFDAYLVAPPAPREDPCAGFDLPVDWDAQGSN